ncbi:MAG: hypothetical protein WCK42_04830 [Myxococcaceae bacterium]
MFIITKLFSWFRKAPQIDIAENPVKEERKRYSIAELLDGSSWKNMSSVNRSATKASEGINIGGELL